jgi:hypothetical protein
MTGPLVLAGRHEPIDRDVRAVLHGDAEIRLRDRRRLSGIWLAANETDVHDVTGPLGPDAAASLRRSSGPCSTIDAPRSRPPSVTKRQLPGLATR